MPTLPIDSNRFEPLHDAHAIEQVIMAVQFSRTVDDEQLRQILAKADVLSTDLPGRNDFQGVSVMIGPNGVSSSAPANGRAYTNTRPDGIIDSELRVDRAALLFRTIQYTRWINVWRRASVFFSSLVPMYGQSTGVAHISLNIVDKFIWMGEPTRCSPGELLNEKSPLVCPHVFTAVELWHSHTGLFSRASDSVKRLINVNVDCADHDFGGVQRRVVTVTTALTDFLNQPGYAPTTVNGENAVQFLDIQMQALHAENKRILGTVIGDQMSKRIALFS